jgi:hypothetical protein
MAQVESSPGKNTVFGNVAVTAQISTQSNPGAGLQAAQPSQVTLVSPYGEFEAGVPHDPAVRPKRS